MECKPDTKSGGSSLRNLAKKDGKPSESFSDWLASVVERKRAEFSGSE